MKIKGKANHHLSVLIPKKIEATLELLVNSREECGISSENVYLFPNQKDMYRDPFRAIEKFAKKYNLEFPNSIKTCTLRSHMATSMLLLNLEEREKDKG